LAHAYERNKSLAEARIAYGRAANLAPEVDWIRFQAGQFYAGVGEPNDLLAAEQEYKAMIDVSSNKAWAHSTLADLYVNQGRLEEAVAEYRAALKTEPETAGLWISLADVLLRLEQVAEAREDYDRAVKLAPDDFYVQFKSGNFLFTQGELEAAITHWEVAHQINPKDCGLLLNMGRAYELLGDQQQAENLYREALSNKIEPKPECQAEARKRLGKPAP
jgi:tetratricopeptide (TPR) repeat protein